MDDALWVVRTDGGACRPIAVAGPVSDPRPSPDGTLIAYVSRGSLRVVGTDGTGDRPLAEPEAADVTYGSAAHVTAGRGYWWSPSGDALLVARVDSAMVRCRYVGDPANPDWPPRPVRYPAAGTANAEISVHIVTIAGDRTPVRLPITANPAATAGPAAGAAMADAAGSADVAGFAVAAGSAGVASVAAGAGSAATAGSADVAGFAVAAGFADAGVFAAAAVSAGSAGLPDAAGSAAGSIPAMPWRARRTRRVGLLGGRFRWTRVPCRGADGTHPPSSTSSAPPGRASARW